MSLLQALAAVVAQGATFTCTPVAVWDGDGPIWCSEGPKIRLAGIAAREIDGTCRPSHPCPRASGVKARDHLVRLLGRPAGKRASGHIKISGPLALSCQSDGSGKGDRTAAWCRTPAGVDVNCAMLASGYAVRWARYDPRGRCR